MSDDLITRLRDLSVTLGRFRSDDEVDEALHDAADRIAALEADNERLRKALEEVQSAQSSNHGCMATILSDISKIAAAALEPKP